LISIGDLLVVGDLSVGHFDEQPVEIFSLVLMPSLEVGLEVGVGTGHLVVQKFHLLAQLETENKMATT